jgi:hypothetical protein
MITNLTPNGRFTASSARCLRAPSGATVVIIPTDTHEFGTFCPIVVPLHANHFGNSWQLSNAPLRSFGLQTFRRAPWRSWNHSMPIPRLRAGTLYASEVPAG